MVGWQHCAEEQENTDQNNQPELHQIVYRNFEIIMGGYYVTEEEVSNGYTRTLKNGGTGRTILKLYYRKVLGDEPEYSYVEIKVMVAGERHTHILESAHMTLQSIYSVPFTSELAPVTSTRKIEWSWEKLLDMRKKWGKLLLALDINFCMENGEELEMIAADIDKEFVEE